MNRELPEPSREQRVNEALAAYLEAVDSDPSFDRERFLARYPDLVMRVDTDREQAVRTRRGFFERYCDTDTLCCTMHFPSPSVGHIKRWGDGFRLDYSKG